MLPRAFDHARTRPQPRALPLKYEHDRLSCDQAHDSRMAALKKEVETLRMDNAALSQQVGRYTKDFEVCATREEFEGIVANRSDAVGRQEPRQAMQCVRVMDQKGSLPESAIPQSWQLEINSNSGRSRKGQPMMLDNSGGT